MDRRERIGDTIRRTLLALTVAFAPAAFAPAAHAMVEVDHTSVDGVPVWYVSDDSVPVVHLILTFKEAGTTSDPDTLGGRAMLASNLLGEGAGGLKTLAFHKALEARAIRFWTKIDHDNLSVHVHMLKEQLPEASRLLTLALTDPRNDADAMETAKREQLVSYKWRRESPDHIAGRAWSEAMMGNHPYARDGVGDEASIAALTKADLDAYRARYITRANLQVAAAGDISASDLKRALGPLVDTLPEAFFPERDMPGVVLDGKGAVQRITQDSPQSVVLFGGLGIGRADKQFYAAYLMNEVLGGSSLSTRLIKAIRVKKGLAYGVNSWLQNMEGADLLAGRLSTRNETVDEAIALVKETVQDVAKNGLTARECRDVKREVSQRFMLQLDSTQSIAEVVAFMMRYDLGRDYMLRRASYFEHVRCKDIQAAAQRLLKPEHWLFVVVGGESNPGTGAAQEAP